MSELGLGLEEEEERSKERRRRRMRRRRKEGQSLYRTTDLGGRERSDPEKGALYPSSNYNITSSPHNNPPSTSKVTRENLVQGEEEEEEEEEEEILDPANHAFSITVTGEDAVQGEEEEEEETLDPENYSFSHSLKEECQNPRFRSKVRQLPRTASLDLNIQNAAILSPQFFVGGIGGSKKSPWTSNYQKGWSSERFPLPTKGSRMHLGSGALFPFSTGRTLPSKWEDAERWIGSPISVDGIGRPLVLPSYYRRPKSKSGPLGAHSPLVPCFDSGRVVNVAASSPFLAGVLVADRQCCGSVRAGGGGCGGGGKRFYSANMESYIVHSAGVHGWSDMSSQDIIQDEKLDSKEGSIIVFPKVLQKDMATQMSHVGSTHSSSKKRPSLSSPPSANPIVELETHFSKLEVRDVQVDDQITVTRRPKKHVASDRCLRNIIDWNNKTEEGRASAWEVSEPSKFISKYNREEAKITAWERLQEAKAEDAIRKLEMKLEKERYSSMDKILNKLRSAQRKAEEMQCAVTTSPAHQASRTTRRASFLNKLGQMFSLSGCFTCHAS